jgi:hypothetical protein
MAAARNIEYRLQRSQHQCHFNTVDGRSSVKSNLDRLPNHYAQLATLVYVCELPKREV